MTSVRLTTLKKKPVTPFTKSCYHLVIGVILGLFLVHLMQSCAQDNLSDINYHIGQDTRWQGLSLKGKERNLSAFNNELLLNIARHEHFRVYLTVTSHPLEELKQGKLQGIITTLQPNSLYENKLLFSDPYFLIGPVLIVPVTAPKNGWNEKRKKIVGIQRQSSLIANLKQDPSIQIKFYEDILTALTDLTERRIDGAIFPVIPAYTYTQIFYKHELKIATPPLTNEGLRLVTLNNQSGKLLIQKFNEGLKTLEQEEVYHQMLERWGLIDIKQIIPQSQ